MKTSQVLAALGEAGFDVVDFDPWNISARHFERPIWARARSAGGGEWSIRIVEGSASAWVAARSVPQLVGVLTTVCGQDSRRRTGPRS